MGDLLGAIKRRVQLTGGSTYIISLPKEWAKSVGIKQGTEVTLEVMPDYTLRIIPPYSGVTTKALRKELSVGVGDAEVGIMEVISAYLVGYSEVRVRFEGPLTDKLRSFIEVVRSKVIGLEALEETSDSVLLYTVVDTSSIPMNEAFKRMIRTTLSMLDDVESSLLKYDEEVLNGVIKRDDVVDKLFLLILKQLNQALLGKISPSDLGITSLPETLYILTAAKSVERVADHAALTAEKLLMKGGKISLPDIIIELFRESKKLFEEAVKAFIKADRKLARSVAKRAKEMKRREERVREEIANTLNFPEMHFILDSIRRVLAYSIDITESAINVATVRELIGESLGIE